MQITLCSREIYDELQQIADEHPELIFQNNGYEYLDRSIREAKAEQMARVSAILKERVTGFHRFFNFKNSPAGLVLRFDYDWGAKDKSRYFIGVGYLLLSELLNGFKEERT